MIQFNKACRFSNPLLLVVSVLSTLASSVQAATYYVATTGNDANTCMAARSVSSPRKTLGAGVKCLAGGDTLIVAAGTYERGVYWPPAGTATAYTTIRAADGARPRIVRRPLPAGKFDRGFECIGRSCSYIEMRGFEFDRTYNGAKLNGNVELGYPHHVRFIDNIFHDASFQVGSSARGFEGGDHLIRGNLFYEVGAGSPGYGPGVNTIYNPGNRTIIEGNTFHNCTFAIGIWNQHGNHIAGVVIRGNRFHDLGRFDVDPWQISAVNTSRGSGAIHITVPGGGHQIYNNLFYRNGPPPSSSARFVAVRVGLKADSSSSALIYNNTFYDFSNSRSVPVNVESDIPPAAVVVRNNIFFRAGAILGNTTESHNLVTDPSFQNAAAGDFRLRPGSFAINRGTTLSPVVTTDFSGLARPQGGVYDIGAFEFVTSTGSSRPKPPNTLRVR